MNPAPPDAPPASRGLLTNPAVRFRVNAPAVISETIDGETVIINLETGAYYSLCEAGAAVWQLVQRGATSQTIGSDLVQRYDAPPETIEAGIRSLLDELAREKLIVPQDGGRPAPELTRTVSADRDRRLPFSPPALQKFTDMADLLLLDPIHDVGEPGWPAPRRAR